MQIQDIHLPFNDRPLYEMMHLGNHPSDLRRVFMFDNMVETLEPQGLNSSSVAGGVADTAPDPLYTEFRHYASPP